MQNLTSLTQDASGNITVKSGTAISGSITPTALAVNGLGARGTARFTFDATGTAGNRTVAAHGTGVTLPANAVVIGGFIEVNTAFTSADSTATIAISVNGANDIISAAAVSGAPYSTTGLKAIVPKNNTPESTGIKCATAKEITCTVAVQALTGGKLTGFLDYVISAATA